MIPDPERKMTVKEAKKIVKEFPGNSKAQYLEEIVKYQNAESFLAGRASLEPVVEKLMELFRDINHGILYEIKKELEK